MSKRSRRIARSDGVREANAIAANLGRELRPTRKRRRRTQAQLGNRVGLSQAQISLLENGAGARTSIETWVAIGIALDRPVAIGFSRDVVAPLNDAGHLEAQELVLRLATAGGWRAAFESRPDADGFGMSTDVTLERDATVVLVEIWNRLDDLGAAVRSSDRKLGAAAKDARSFWLLVDTLANRTIIRRYPRTVRPRFPGSSAAWVQAVTGGASVPSEPGIAWVDLRGRTLRPMRRRG